MPKKSNPNKKPARPSFRYPTLAEAAAQFPSSQSFPSVCPPAQLPGESHAKWLERAMLGGDGPVIGVGQDPLLYSYMSRSSTGDYARGARAVNTSPRFGWVEPDEVSYVSRRMQASVLPGYADRLDDLSAVDQATLESYRDYLMGAVNNQAPNAGLYPEIVVNDAVPDNMLVAVSPSGSLTFTGIFQGSGTELADWLTTFEPTQQEPVADVFAGFASILGEPEGSQYNIPALPYLLERNVEQTVPEVETIPCELVDPEAKLGFSELIRVESPFDIFLDESDLPRLGMAYGQERILW